MNNGMHFDFTDRSNPIFEELNRKINNVPLTDIFSDDFMQASTKYNSFQEMLDRSGITCSNINDLENVQEWNDYVRSVTDFESWKDMARSAFIAYLRH